MRHSMHALCVHIIYCIRAKTSLLALTQIEENGNRRFYLCMYVCIRIYTILHHSANASAMHCSTNWRLRSLRQFCIPPDTVWTTLECTIKFKLEPEYKRTYIQLYTFQLRRVLSILSRRHSINFN